MNIFNYLILLWLLKCWKFAHSVVHDVCQTSRCYTRMWVILSKKYHITICKIISLYITLGILICEDTVWYPLWNSFILSSITGNHHFIVPPSTPAWYLYTWHYKVNWQCDCSMLADKWQNAVNAIILIACSVILAHQDFFPLNISCGGSTKDMNY